jgi:hypothetical protein
MIRSFAARAIIPVSVTVTGFVVFGCLVLYTLIRADLAEQDARHERDIAETVQLSMRHAMMRDDREGLEQIIRGVGEAKVVTHLRIFSKRRGRVTFSADPAETGRAVDKGAEGCVECHPADGAPPPSGRMEQMRTFEDAAKGPVLALMVSIPNEISCAEAACHAHPPGERVLGTLDIGLSQQAMHDTLGRIRLHMAVFCLMVLVLTVGGVSAILWRRVFLPVRELVSFSEGVVRASGREPCADGELDEIESAIRSVQEMAESCHEMKVHRDHVREKGDGTAT